MRHHHTLHKSLRRKRITGTALMVIPQPEPEDNSLSGFDKFCVAYTICFFLAGILAVVATKI